MTVETEYSGQRTLGILRLQENGLRSRTPVELPRQMLDVQTLIGDLLVYPDISGWTTLRLRNTRQRPTFCVSTPGVDIGELGLQE